MDVQDMGRKELLEEAARLEIDVKASWPKAKLLEAVAAIREPLPAPGMPEDAVSAVPTAPEVAETAPDPHLDRSTLVARAIRYGLHVPDDWGVERITAVLESIGAANDTVPPVGRRRRASPRG